MEPTKQQSAVVDHDCSRHGRVIAGPGTGKSWTAIELLRRARAEQPALKVGLLTFTRAATAELLKKVAEQGLEWLRPSTIHAYALRLLVQNAGDAGIDLPLRIPDSWEATNLIRKDLARRLRLMGFAKADSRAVGRLEREMAAAWESLDEKLGQLGAGEPELRNAFVGQWQAHRRLFQYLLLAEIPFRAGNLLEDFQPELSDLGFLIVDEYQDLNRADIRVIEDLAKRGVKVLAVGDDDQSIYGFRMAAPAGIAEFSTTFPGAADYPLTISMRCGHKILDAATMLIETAPARIRRPRMTVRPGSLGGTFAYLRFSDQDAEASGVADLVARRLSAGVPPSEVAVLVRSGVDVWSSLIAPRFEAAGIPLVDTDWVDRALADVGLRRVLARARLAISPTDSLAWWTVLELGTGIAADYIALLADSVGAGRTFGEFIVTDHSSFAKLSNRPSARATAGLVAEEIEATRRLAADASRVGTVRWGSWLASNVAELPLCASARSLLDGVDNEIEAGVSLGEYLGQLEPVGKDLATRAAAVRLMSMSASKGLTVNSAFLMGVEKGILPHPKASVDEERRLLYVAMTRATDYCALTWAARRTGPTARRGDGRVSSLRARCPLFEGLPIGRWQDGATFLSSATNPSA